MLHLTFLQDVTHYVGLFVTLSLWSVSMIPFPPYDLSYFYYVMFLSLYVFGCLDRELDVWVETVVG